MAEWTAWAWLVFAALLGLATSGDPVTCGSVLKLLNLQVSPTSVRLRPIRERFQHHVRLHSHDVKYGSGSGQQSCTGMPDMDDHNSHWLVKAKSLPTQ